MGKLNVLVVDDANFIREFIRRGLTSAMPEAAVVEALNGRHAQEILTKKPVDIILCDWEMPEVDGHELLSWVRSDERFRDMPFIMVTSRGEKSHVVTALRAGIDGYVVKPFTIDMLIGKIHEALARHGKTIPQEPRSMFSTTVPFAESVSILTGAYRKDHKETKDVKEVKEVKETKEDLKGARNLLSRVNAQLRHDGHAIRCLVQRLDLNGAVAVMPREDGNPAVADQVVFALTLDTPPIQVKDINAVITAVDAVESRNETKFIRLTLRFVDEDPKKRDSLSRMITSV